MSSIEMRAFASELQAALAPYACWLIVGEHLTSGVLVDLNGKPCIATVSHALHPHEPGRDVRVVTKQSPIGRPLTGATVLIADFAGDSENDRGEPPDVAVVVLPDQLAAVISSVWFPEDRILSGAARPGHLAFGIGFPSAQVQQQGAMSWGVPFAFISEVAEPPSNPAREWDPDVDLAIHYSDEADDGSFTIWGDHDTLPYPGGMSGCAWYTVPRCADGKVWSADDIFLAGIQSAVLESGRLRAVRSEHLRFVARGVVRDG